MRFFLQRNRNGKRTGMIDLNHCQRSSFSGGRLVYICKNPVTHYYAFKRYKINNFEVFCTCEEHRSLFPEISFEEAKKLYNESIMRIALK